MKEKYQILIFGASYGSLLGIKLQMTGHNVDLVCLPDEVNVINKDGVRVRLPLKNGSVVELDSRRMPGRLAAMAPRDVDPGRYDLVGLAMQEPQFRSAGVRELLNRVAKARVPAMSIMNMPPLPYLGRLPGVAVETLSAAYADPSVWKGFDSSLMTLCSPDPQAFRPPGEGANVLQVSLPTNFKVARFEADQPTAILKTLQDDIDALRWSVDGRPTELPVKLKLHDSVFVPLAKWAMLLTGNYRCVTPSEPRSIREAVHSDIVVSRAIYEWVCDVCRQLGAAAGDMVPFEKYAGAADGLTRPSSAARALFAGAHHIERVDRLVRTIASERGMGHPALDATVDLVDSRLAINRAAAA